jgi:hypothetical protein
VRQGGYSNHYEIYELSIDGKNVRRITNSADPRSPHIFLSAISTLYRVRLAERLLMQDRRGRAKGALREAQGQGFVL